MKHLSFLCTALCAVLLLWNCSSDDGNSAAEPKLEILSADTDSEVPEEGAALSIRFSSNLAWEAKADRDWCHVSPASGEAGTMELSVYVDENPEYDARTATVTLTSGQLTKSFTVKQKQKGAFLLTDREVEADANGGEVSVRVQANVAFDCLIDEKAQSWISYQGKTRGLEESALRFTIAPNDGYEKRTGLIILRNDSQEEHVTVTQNGQAPTLTLTPTEWSIGSDGGSIDIAVECGVDYDISWNAGDWIAEEASPAANVHRFKILPNLSLDERRAEIVFGNPQYGLSQTATVVQSGAAPMLVLSEHEIRIENTESTVRIEVKHNVEYGVALSNPGCLAHNTQYTDYTDIHTFTIAANPTAEERRIEILFTNQEYGLTEQAVIVQVAGDFIEVEPNVCETGAEGGTLEIKVRTSVAPYNLTASASADWVSCSFQSNDTEERVLVLNIKPNTENQDRQCTVSLNGGSASQEIQITQKAATHPNGGIEDLPHIEW